jgi:ribosomal protein S18 acetylase RimI-like enzyme
MSWLNTPDVQVSLASIGSEADVAAYRRLRLLALRSDPSAFGSTYERELSFDDQRWKNRLGSVNGRSGGILLADAPAIVHGEPIGLTGVGLDDPDEHPTVEKPVYVSSVWVDPRARAHRVGETLLHAAKAWATERGSDALVLDVVEDNVRARHLFERFGFLPSGRTSANPNTGAAEVEMILRLVASPEGEVGGNRSTPHALRGGGWAVA